jgi:hypothetical protein
MGVRFPLGANFFMQLRSAALFLAFLTLPRPAAAAPVFDGREPGIRITSAVVQALVDTVPATPPNKRAYYIRGSSLVYSAITADNGLTFTEDQGVRLSSQTTPALDIAISSITGLSILPLNAGGFRMVYSVIGTTGSYRLYTATSADGLGWANQSTPTIAAAAAGTFMGHPSLVKLASGNWALYHVRNTVSGSAAAGTNHVSVAFSENEGTAWGAPAVAISTRAGRISAVKLTNDKVRVFYTSPLAGGTSEAVVVSALSSNALGSSFSLETGVAFSTDAGKLHGLFVARATDTFRFRAYYGYDPVSPSTADAYSALTNAAAPEIVSPSLLYNTNAASRVSITGDVFSLNTAPTLFLSKAGQADIPGTGVTASNDQTLTADFNTLDAALGLWDLNVTNFNGPRTTLANAVRIDFPGGSVDTTDNLFRPLNGGAASIAITTFSPGRVTARVYTIDGRFIQTLFDSEKPRGTLTLTWNGVDARGARVASGVYLLRVRGPKLDDTSKIIVIK